MAGEVHRAIRCARIPAERTFPTRAEAAAFLAGMQANLDRGAYVDPVARAEIFGEYAMTWLAQRDDLRPRSAELYAGLLNRHLLPHIGAVPLARLTPAAAVGGMPVGSKAGSGGPPWPRPTGC